MEVRLSHVSESWNLSIRLMQVLLHQLILRLLDQCQDAVFLVSSTVLEYVIDQQAGQEEYAKIKADKQLFYTSLLKGQYCNSRLIQ